MSGLELLPKAKAVRPDVSDTKRKALENGAEALLTKPIDFGTIYREAGRFCGSLSVGNEAIACCERYGFVARMGTVLLQTGGAYCRLGETERGLADSRTLR